MKLKKKVPSDAQRLQITGHVTRIFNRKFIGFKGWSFWNAYPFSTSNNMFKYIVLVLLGIVSKTNAVVVGLVSLNI